MHGEPRGKRRRQQQSAEQTRMRLLTKRNGQYETPKHRGNAHGDRARAHAPRRAEDARGQRQTRAHLGTKEIEHKDAKRNGHHERADTRGIKSNRGGRGGTAADNFTRGEQRSADGNARGEARLRGESSKEPNVKCVTYEKADCSKDRDRADERNDATADKVFDPQLLARRRCDDGRRHITADQSCRGGRARRSLRRCGG